MKKLVIVCEDATRKHGDFMAQLVSAIDDKIDEIVGVKDGEVAAQVWTQKEYESNAVQISSEQYILFVGNSKLMKSKREHMLIKFEKFGMKYGWLGKQAFLFVDEDVKNDEYKEFIEYARNYNPEMKALIDKEQDVNQGNEDEKIIEFKGDTFEGNVIEIGKEKVKVAANVVGKFVGDAVKKANESITNMQNSKSIKAQQYGCAVLLMYLNDLSEFLGL